MTCENVQGFPPASFGFADNLPGKPLVNMVLSVPSTCRPACKDALFKEARQRLIDSMSEQFGSMPTCEDGRSALSPNPRVSPPYCISADPRIGQTGVMWKLPDGSVLILGHPISWDSDVALTLTNPKLIQDESRRRKPSSLRRSLPRGRTHSDPRPGPAHWVPHRASPLLKWGREYFTWA
jgi:hypothetical protein